MVRPLAHLAFLCVLLLGVRPVAAQSPVQYRLSFSEREHRQMQVEVVFRDVPEGPLHVRMSRSSPGRYSLHEFAKNVFDVKATGESGDALTISRPSPSQWDVTGHSGVVRVTYRVFGDRVDGTYLGIDSSHAHINMPAALMWAHGFENRAVSMRFDAPANVTWRVASQLLTGPNPLTFTAPSLAYLMDSPVEFGAFALRSFTLSDDVRTPVFRLVVHHQGTDADVDGFARDVESIVREARNVYSEYPAYEGNTYTFLADYVPWAHGDGMEHRNSTVLTSSSSIRANRLGLLDTVAHEFFHSWNVERIRPKSLEPFNLDDVNMSGELWLAEGFTNYYAPLVTLRAGLTTVTDFARDMSYAVSTVLTHPGRRVRSAIEMSQFAPFTDASVSVDRTSFDNTYISYYTWGTALGLGLDLALRDKTDGKASLDLLMRALWEKYGRTTGGVAGVVQRPYTLADVEATLAEVAGGDTAFAREYFAKYVEGHEAMPYASLLAKAGFVLRTASPGRPSIGDVRLDEQGGHVRVNGAVPFGSPAYSAGLEQDDVIVSLGGNRVTTTSEVDRFIAARKPGTAVQVVFERRGQPVTATLDVIEDPRLEVITAEQAGQSLSEAQQRFRRQWLSSVFRNTFQPQ